MPPNTQPCYIPQNPNPCITCGHTPQAKPTEFGVGKLLLWGAAGFGIYSALKYVVNYNSRQRRR